MVRSRGNLFEFMKERTKTNSVWGGEKKMQRTP